MLLLALGRAGVMLVGGGGLLILVFGLWLVHLGHWGYGASWVDAAILLFLIALALGAVGGQRPKQARQLAGQLAGRGEPISDELRGLLDDRVSRSANCGSALIVLAILALRVFK